jgi:hypothetical protein
VAGSADIFFSYPGRSPEDNGQVALLADSLARFGLTSWIAGRDLPTSHERGDRNPILEALDGAAAVVVCSGRSQGGSWRTQELKRIAERVRDDPGFVVIGVVLPGGEVGPAFNPSELQGRMHNFDFRAGVETVAPLIPILWRRVRPALSKLLEEVVSACKEGTVALVGPPGSGKSILAEVATEQLRPSFPAGQMHLSLAGSTVGPEVAEAVLRALGIDVPEEPAPPIEMQYRWALERDRYLVVIDEVDLDAVEVLIPPEPSSGIFISLGRPRASARYRIFALPATLMARMTDPDDLPLEVRPGYASDIPDGPDLLEMQRSVNALCSIVAAKSTVPPLSIGLFGDWGAGKSFFLSRMRRRIKLLSDASAGADGDTAYVESVRQVVFNAWHYADANLWASLASRVFEGLIEETDGAMKGLIGELESSRQQLEVATEHQRIATERHHTAADEARSARNELSESRMELRDIGASAQEVLDELGEGDESTILSFAGSVSDLWSRSKWWAALVAIAVVAGVALEVLLPGVYGWLVASVAASVGFLGVVGGPLREVLRTRKAVERRAAALRTQREVELEARVDAAMRTESDAVQRRDAAQRSVEEAELEIREIKDGRRLYRFIEDRAGTEAYGKYLGLVSLVRKDFERLASLIDQHEEPGRSEWPRLERIVLYIDDLDRCPAPRVVEVLEAVHLLLASELFVVVVSVDPRWLVRSLRQHYAAEMPERGGGQMSASPQGYLEKIFQIPFSLPPMTAEGYRRLVTSLITEAEIERPPDDAKAVVDVAWSPGDGTVEREVRGSGRSAERAGVRINPLLGADPIDLNPKGLRITSEELEYLTRLSRMVSTPRAVKRLLNLYRLVRVSLTVAQLERLLGGYDGKAEFPCVQVLLAITVGFPSLAPWFLSELVRRDEGDWWNFIGSLKAPESESDHWNELRSALESLRDSAWPNDLVEAAGWVSLVSQFSYDQIS